MHAHGGAALPVPVFLQVPGIACLRMIPGGGWQSQAPGFLAMASQEGTAMLTQWFDLLEHGGFEGWAAS